MDLPGAGHITVVILDVRCSAVLATSEVAPARCQLYAGHEGKHAVVTTGAPSRHLWLWHGRHISGSSLGDGVPYQLAWAPGCPEVAPTTPVVAVPA